MGLVCADAVTLHLLRNVEVIFCLMYDGTGQSFQEFRCGKCKLKNPSGWVSVRSHCNTPYILVHRCRNASAQWRSNLERWRWHLWSLFLQQSTLQLPHRDHARHMILLLSSTGSVSLAPRHAAMQVLRSIPGRNRRSAGGVHLLLLPLGAHGWVVSGAVLGAWIGVVCCVGMLGCRVAGGGMCGRSSARLSRSKRRADMLGRLISTASSSTMMHHMLRSRVRRRRKCIG